MSLTRLFRTSVASRAITVANRPTSLRCRQRPALQDFIASPSTQIRKMSEGAHPHMHRNELFNMTGFTAVVTGGGTGEPLSTSRWTIAVDPCLHH